MTVMRKPAMSADAFPEATGPLADFQKKAGLIPRQRLHALIQHRKLIQATPDIEDSQIQPASVDLRLGAKAYRVRASFLPSQTMAGAANVLILPNLDAANILFNVLKMTGGQGVTVGPILLGAAAPAHVLTPSATVRRVVNLTALTVASAGLR